MAPFMPDVSSTLNAGEGERFRDTFLKRRLCFSSSSESEDDAVEEEDVSSSDVICFLFRLLLLEGPSSLSSALCFFLRDLR